MAEVIAVEVDEETVALLKEQQRVREELLENLAKSVQSKFDMRARKRSSKEAQWLRSAQLYYGKLSLDGALIKGETPFEGITPRARPDVNVVRTKCSIAIAQTVSMQFGTSDKNWDLWPSKRNTDPQASASCKLMSDTIEQQLADTKYSFEARKSMWDRVVLGTGVLKGPVSVGEQTRSYEKLEGTTTWVPVLTVDYKPTLRRVNPWFLYPDDTTDNVAALGDAIEVHPMTALELKKLMSHDGFMRTEIEKVLEQKPEDYNSSNWTDFALLSENNPNLFKNKYMVLEYHGPITRTQLDALEIEPTYDSLNDEYYGEVWVCQGEVIRLELESIEASFKVPYYISVWERDPGSVFGYGVPLMMDDAQRVVNEAWHMILDNSSMSSGPQVAMHKHLIEPANGKWELGPNQIWYLNDLGVRVDDAIQFFNVPNVTQQIIPILQMAQGFAEEESQIPLITAGLASPEPADTATGQLVMQHASTTLLDFMSEEWDDNMTGPIISSFYAWNMQNNPDAAIKGAYDVDVRTSTQYKNKQLHVRDLEKLSVEAAQNPELAKHINMGNLSRVRLSMMQIPDSTIIRTPEEVMAIEEEQANQPPPIEMLELQMKAREMDLKEAQLDFEQTQAQQREAWEHEERMTANAARLVESEARVTVSQNEKEIALLELAMRNDELYAKLNLQSQIARENNQTKAFAIGIQEARKQQEVDQYRREIDLAATKGSGV